MEQIISETLPNSLLKDVYKHHSRSVMSIVAQILYYIHCIQNHRINGKSDRFQIGIIGCGNVGRMLIETLAHFKIVPLYDIFVYTRTHDNLELPRGVNLMKECQSVCERCRCVVISCLPIQYNFLVANSLTADVFQKSKAVFISCMAGISIDKLKLTIAAPILRTYPSTNLEYTAFQNISDQKFNILNDILFLQYSFPHEMKKEMLSQLVSVLEVLLQKHIHDERFRKIVSLIFPKLKDDEFGVIKKIPIIDLIHNHFQEKAMPLFQEKYVSILVNSCKP